VGRAATAAGADPEGAGGGAAAGKKALTPRSAPGSLGAVRGVSNAGAKGRRRKIGAGVDWQRTLAAKGRARLAPEHLRFRRQPVAAGRLHCLVLDCSGSMLKHDNLSLAKGLLLGWTQWLYRQRAELAVIGFGGGGARVLQPPRRAVAFNDDWIGGIGGGGGTPVADALKLAQRLMAQSRRRTPGRQQGLWLLTDGRFNALPPRPRHADFCVVVDFERDAVALGRAARIAGLWQAEHVHACRLRPGSGGPVAERSRSPGVFQTGAST
jgi:magnesium chelatase subunit ChlD-like protein